MLRIILTLLACAVAQTVRAYEISPSTLSAEKAKADARERAFEPWAPASEEQAIFDQLTSPKKNLLPIYSERKAGRVRGIYVKKPDGALFWTFAGMDLATFQKRHAKHKEEGFVLLTCVVVAGPLGEKEYWATWIAKDSLKEMQGQLRRFGISPASVTE